MRHDIFNPLQGTVAQAIKFAGVGLHSGKTLSLEIQPLGPNQGIYFLRTDISNAPRIHAHPDNIISTVLCTTLGLRGVSVATVEHILSACAGTGIDNALILVSGPEVPILDGSSAPFVDKISEVGVQLQQAKRKIIRPRKAIEVKVKDQFIHLRPFDQGTFKSSSKRSNLLITCAIDFPRSKAIGQQTLTIEFSPASYMNLCEARTFCHIEDVRAMRTMNLALGGSLDNAVVVNNDKVINNDGLRYENEFVRHKILDCIGDLSMLGGQLEGHLTLHKAGHSLHASFMKEVLQQDKSLDSLYIQKNNKKKVEV